MNHSMPLPRRLAPQRRPATLPAARRAAVYAAMLCTLCASWFAAPSAQASSLSPYVGELMLFGGSFCPMGWLPADGRTVDIAEYEVLFSLLGTTYGGDGRSTFHLPDLRGRAAVGQGAGPGLMPQALGSRAGAESATLTTAQMPAHTHTVPASTQPATHATPAPGLLPATAQNGGAYASVANTSTGMAVPLAGSNTGGSQPFPVRSPYLAMRWCIAVHGLYPQRP